MKMVFLPVDRGKQWAVGDIFSILTDGHSPLPTVESWSIFARFQCVLSVVSGSGLEFGGLYGTRQGDGEEAMLLSPFSVYTDENPDQLAEYSILDRSGSLDRVA